MKVVETRRHIPATPEAVWKTLTDPKTIGTPDFGIDRLEGELHLGAKFKLWASISPKRAFALKVAELVPNEKMAWLGGMPLGLFRGYRTFSLTAANGGTDFHMREEFSGLLLPMIWGSMPDLNPSFERFAEALEAAATKSA